MRRTLTLVATLAAAGCAPLTPFPGPLLDLPRLNHTEAEEQLAQGLLSVSGSAFYRQRGGGLVTCAGEDVYLIPATNYARYRFKQQFLNEAPDGLPARLVRFSNEDPAFLQLALHKKCSVDGSFKFTGVSAGYFYILTQAQWVVTGTRQGGPLAMLIEVKDTDLEGLVLTTF